MDVKQSPLVSFLMKQKEDRAMLAALRRGLGQAPGTVADMFPIVIPFISDKAYADEEWSAYQVAALFALHPLNSSEGNMGNHLKKLESPSDESSPTERRFTQMLRLRRESLDARLRQHIQLLKANQIPVNWHQLHYDLRYWSHPDRFVQRQWAEAFWRSA